MCKPVLPVLMGEFSPACLRNNLAENLLPYGDREVGQDFADFVYGIYADDSASILLLILLFVLGCFI